MRGLFIFHDVTILASDPHTRPHYALLLYRFKITGVFSFRLVPLRSSIPPPLAHAAVRSLTKLPLPIAVLRGSSRKLTPISRFYNLHTRPRLTQRIYLSIILGAQTNALGILVVLVLWKRCGCCATIRCRRRKPFLQISGDLRVQTTNKDSRPWVARSGLP